MSIRHLLGLAALVLPVVVFTACGMVDNTSDIKTSPTPTDTAPVDAGATEASVLGPATGDGFVLLGSRPAETPTFFAAFRDRDELSSSGAIYEIGACRIAEPPPPSNFDDGYRGVKSAGLVEAKAGTRSAKLRFDSSVGYYQERFSGASTPLAPDVPVEIRAEGAEVPAFEATIFPAPVLALAMSPSDGVRAGEALEITWAVPERPDLVLSVKLHGAGATILCLQRGDAGHLVVPKELIEQIAAHPGNVAGCPSCLTFVASVDRHVAVRAGDFDVRVIHSVDLPVQQLPLH